MGRGGARRREFMGRRSACVRLDFYRTRRVFLIFSGFVLEGDGFRNFCMVGMFLAHRATGSRSIAQIVPRTIVAPPTSTSNTAAGRTHGGCRDAAIQAVRQDDVRWGPGFERSGDLHFRALCILHNLPSPLSAPKTPCPIYLVWGMTDPPMKHRIQSRESHRPLPPTPRQAHRCPRQA